MSGSRSDIVMRPIGVIHSPHQTATGTPIQPAFAEQVEGEVVVDAGFEAALTDIEGFERIWLVYCLDRARPFQAKVIPYRDNREHGLFATRAPCRPNPIGLSVVWLLAREDNVLRVRGLDILDGTPLLDIKPYVPEFDAFPDSNAGWLAAPREVRTEADGRFHGPDES